MEPGSSFALVLGAGGTVGMAYHAGTLKALKDVCGFDAADADLLVRPCAEELKVHGRNLMAPDVAEDVARSAYECAARQLEGGAQFRRAAA